MPALVEVDEWIEYGNEQSHGPSEGAVEETHGKIYTRVWLIFTNIFHTRLVGSCISMAKYNTIPNHRKIPYEKFYNLR